MADPIERREGAEAAKRRAEFERLKSQPGLSLRWKIRLVALGVPAVILLIALAAQSGVMLFVWFVAVAIAGAVWRRTRRF